jgi:chromosome segregation ATPase
MLRRPFIASAIAIIALIIVLLIVSLVQGQRHLKAVQKELGKTNEQVVKLEKVIANQKTALDAVNEARTQLESHLNDANADNDQLRKELDASQSQMKENQTHAQELTNELEKTKKEAYAQLTTEREASQRRFETITDETTKKLSESEKRIVNLTEQLKSVSAERDTTQSKFSENQSQLEAMQNEFAKAKEATQQANAKATELETAANAAKDTEAERSKLQAALDQANAEIERLKGELEKQKSTPPEQGESVSPAPGERRL